MVVAEDGEEEEAEVVADLQKLTAMAVKKSRVSLHVFVTLMSRAARGSGPS